MHDMDHIDNAQCYPQEIIARLIRALHRRGGLNSSEGISNAQIWRLVDQPIRLYKKPQTQKEKYDAVAVLISKKCLYQSY